MKQKNGKRKLKVQNTTLLTWQLYNPITAKPSYKCSQPSCSLPYDTPENVHDSNACSARKLPVAKLISCGKFDSDIRNSKASCTLVVEFLMKDAKTLEGVRMNRT